MADLPLSAEDGEGDGGWGLSLGEPRDQRLDLVEMEVIAAIPSIMGVAHDEIGADQGIGVGGAVDWRKMLSSVDSMKATTSDPCSRKNG
jgi:hypothetical protein